MAKNNEHELKMFSAATNARLVESHWDTIPDDERKQMVMDLCYAVRHLMQFRNIINGMIDLKHPADDVVPTYLGQPS